MSKDQITNYISRIGTILGISGAIASPFIAIGVAKAEIKSSIERTQENSSSIKMLWQSVGADRQILSKHEAIIPTIQQDIQELKAGQDEIARDIKTLIRREKVAI